MELNTSLLNANNLEQLTKDNIIDEYLNLQSKYKKQLEENENLRQINYKYKSSINVLENTKTDIEVENDQLQTENSTLRKEIKKFQEQISTLTKEKENLLYKNNDTCEEHAQSIRELEIELEECKKTVTVLNKTNSNLEIENKKVIDELLQLKMEVRDEDETDDIREMKLIIEQQQLDINTYCCRNNNLISELNEIKNILEYKSQQLIDLNHLKESLNDDVATLRTELELLKTNVANPASKGNSLFGEVYDSREKLQKKLSLLKKHCIDIKSKYAVQLAENKKLSNENLILSKQWKDEVNNRFNIEYTWKGAHEQTIEGLKENIKFLKNEIKNLDKFSIPKVPLTEKWMYDNVKELYERNQKLIIEAEEKINQKIFGDLLLSERLNSVEREVNKWKSIATTYEIEKNNLQLELDRLKTKDDPMLNDPQELIELFKDIENKENVSLMSNSSVLNITAESDTSFYAEKSQNIKSEYPKVKLEEGINSMKVSENSLKIEKPIVTFKQENTSAVKDKNVYHTPPPGRVFVPKRRIFVKSIKSEDIK